MLDRTEHKPPASPWQRWLLPALLTGLALLAALLAAACDGGGDPPAATATSAATATATATATVAPAATPAPTATPTPAPATSTATSTPAAATPTATSTPPPATPTATPAVAAFPLTIGDSAGTMVTLDAAPERIISYSPGATEILFAIGAGELASSRPTSSPTSRPRRRRFRSSPTPAPIRSAPSYSSPIC